MAERPLKINILAIDDDRASISDILSNLETTTWWRTNPVLLGDSSAIVEPLTKGVYPNDDESLDSYLGRVKEIIFGHGFEAASSSPKYIPCNIFLVDWKYELNWPPEEGVKPDGVSICREIKKLIPNSFCCLITAHNSLQAGEKEHEEIDAIIEKGDLDSEPGINQLARKIVAYLQKHASSPTWEGLIEYASIDKEVFHALGVADAQNTSLTSSGFIAKFGQNLFSSQASLTLDPLDSLLSPKGCIKDSQNKFAESFGAIRSRFCTNGTTGANGILWSALFDKGDIVIVDKNCHISHHYSAANQSAFPLYVEPEVAVNPDVFGPVGIDRIIDRIHEAADNGYLASLKGIVLTNCTFDGYVLNAQEYIERIDNVLREKGDHELADEFIYLFDEAWFSFARFDPGLIKYTAMFGAKNAKLAGGRSPRVYATQSIHKTLTALRQASVILEHDKFTHSADQFSGIENPRFQQSYLSRTTTSPSAPIVASFDIARRQMCLEGSTLIHDSAKAVDEFIRLLSGEKWRSVKKYFYVDAPPERVNNNITSYAQDPTKLTVFHKLPVFSANAKAQIWKDGNVQVNKYGLDSLMFMFMPGFKVSRMTSLFSKLTSAVSKHSAPVNKQVDIHSEIPPLRFCLGNDLKAYTYPNEVLKGGSWAFNETLFSSLGTNAVLTGIEDIDDDGSYIVGSFITPYPPGFPILYPGQIIKGEEAIQILNLTGEVHGKTESQKILLWKHND